MDTVICGILKCGKGVGVVREAVMKNDGGPAFPIDLDVANCSDTWVRGMSLRD